MWFQKAVRVMVLFAILTSSTGEIPALVRIQEAAQARALENYTLSIEAPDLAESQIIPFQTDLVVYDDALAPAWENWSYSSTVNFNHPNPTLSGPASIAVTYNAAYAGFSVRTSPPLQAQDFSAVSFFIYAPDTDRALSLVVQSSDGGGLGQPFTFNAPANMWSQIVVDLETLGSPAAIARINIGDNSGAAQPVLFLDQITLLTSSSASDQDIPAVIPGAPRPTLASSRPNGYGGQSLTASGKGPAGLGAASAVRLAWLFDGATFTAAEAALDASAAYSAGFTIPMAAPTGPAKLCAALTGTSQAGFTCIDFMIDVPPPAEVTGQLTAELLSSGKQAFVQLANFAGDVLYTAPVSAEGSFDLGKIPPGIYAYAVVGETAVPARSEIVHVYAAQKLSLSFTQILAGAILDPVTGKICLPRGSLASIAGLSAGITDTGIGSLSDNLLSDSPAGPQQTAEAGSRYASQILQLKMESLFREDFGTYINGVNLPNSFTARLTLHSGAVSQVRYHILLPDGKTLVDLPSAAAAPYTTFYNVGLLPIGKSTLIAAPVVNGNRQCPVMREISVVADPMKSSRMQPGSVTGWDPVFKHYRFSGTIGQTPAENPLAHPPGPSQMKYLGEVQSKQKANISVTGTMKLNGVTQLKALASNAQANLINNPVYNGVRDLRPNSSSFYPGLDPTRLRHIAIPTGPQTIWADGFEKEIFNSILFTFFGIVTVGMKITFGLDGSLIMETTIYPFVPALDLVMTPRVDVMLAVTLWVNFLVLADAGADGIGTFTFSMPLHINTSDSRGVWLDDPCLGYKVDIKIWVKVNYLIEVWRRSKTYNLVKDDDPNGCAYGTQLASQLIQQSEINAQLSPPEPRVMASPALAANPNGRAISVYIDDLTPQDERPTPAVMARFKNTNSDTWLPAVQLSQSGRAVHDPAVVFFGDGGSQALAAWTQTEMTADDEASVESLAEIMDQMEIYVNRWNGAEWLGPERLTNDELGDGNPTLAGGPGGAVLAWVRDTDGDSATQADMVIALREWYGFDENWSELQILKAAPTGTNALPSVTISDAGAGAMTSLAWVYDADGSPATLEDRRVHLAYSGPPDYQWTMLNPQPLPTRVSSVSIAADPSDIYILRLVLSSSNLAGDQVSSGGLSNEMSIWTALIDLEKLGPVSAQQLKDEKGQPVRGEQPLLQGGANGEFILTLRRFGETGTIGQLGQIAFSSVGDKDDLAFPPPVYLTGGLNQHWQSAAVINPYSSRLELLAVQRPPINPAALEALNHSTSEAGVLASESQFSPQALTTAAAQADLLNRLRREPTAFLAGGVSVLSSSDIDPLISLSLGDVGDPALDPQLRLSVPHASPGSTVALSTTVRNLGRREVGAVLRFYRGLPGSGVQVGEVQLGYLDLGEVREVTLNYTVQGGGEPLYAEVSPSTAEATSANNIATARMGDLPAPAIGTLRASQVFDKAIEIAILSSAAEAVSGYRVLRSFAPGGPYELVGETTGDLHYDLLLDAGRTYCYVVQAYDRAGITSPYSNEVCSELALNGIYLPLIGR